MTAVEWLFERLDISQGYESAIEVLEQAKAMEKEQLKFFFDKGHLYSGCPHGFQEVYLRTLKPRRYES